MTDKNSDILEYKMLIQITILNNNGKTSKLNKMARSSSNFSGDYFAHFEDN